MSSLLPKFAKTLCILVISWSVVQPRMIRAASPTPANADEIKAKREKLRNALKKLPHKIVFESYRQKDWDLYAMNADGSGKVNLTKNPKVDELYPHGSPDGKAICFVADEGRGRSRVRNVYVMAADGTGRSLVARNARQPCWGPKSRRILYTKGEYNRFTYSSYGTKGLFIYDLAKRKHHEHANRSIRHVCYLCWSPGGAWIFGTVAGGMGYARADLAIEAAGKSVYAVDRIWGCRMDVRPDGKKILWNMDDQSIYTADLDLSSKPPKISNPRAVVSCDWSEKVYHGDWSPCGKYIAFSHGSSDASQHVGELALGWDICVGDASDTNVWVPLSTGGLSSKEPDWIKVAPKTKPTAVAKGDK